MYSYVYIYIYAYVYVYLYIHIHNTSIQTSNSYGTFSTHAFDMPREVRCGNNQPMTHLLEMLKRPPCGRLTLLVCIYIYIYIYTYMNNMYVYVCVYIYIYICLHICVYIHTTHVHILFYRHRYLSSPLRAWTLRRQAERSAASLRKRSADKVM